MAWKLIVNCQSEDERERERTAEGNTAEPSMAGGSEISSNNKYDRVRQSISS